MGDLAVCFGPAARDALCRAIDGATQSIRAEFYDLRDCDVKDAIARALRRGVQVEIRIEHRRHSFATRAVVHAKAAVIDDRTAIFATANLTRSGFGSPGEVCVVDDRAADIVAIDAAIAGRKGPSLADDRIVAGPGTSVREAIEELFGSSPDLRIASEVLSDERILRALIARHAQGRHDRVLVNDKGCLSREQLRMLCRLRGAGVAVHAPASDYMHEKFADDGDRIYVGSANLTRNGLDEGCEIGVVAPATDFGSGAADLRAKFDALWSSSVPV